MDACSIDWDVVSKFTPYGVVLIAYLIWRVQKEKEVFANEAKILLGNLFELDGLLIKQQHDGKEYIAIETDEESIKKIRNIINVMLPRLIFIDEKLSTKEFVSNLKAIDKKLDFDLSNDVKRASIGIGCQWSDQYSNAKSQIQSMYKPLKNIAIYKS